MAITVLRDNFLKLQFFDNPTIAQSSNAISLDDCGKEKDRLAGITSDETAFWFKTQKSHCSKDFLRKKRTLNFYQNQRPLMCWKMDIDKTYLGESFIAEGVSNYLVSLIDWMSLSRNSTDLPTSFPFAQLTMMLSGSVSTSPG